MIDRSNPLPIHQFPRLIDEVARLKELASEMAATDYKSSNPEWHYEVDVLNAAPKLLAILDGFREGDAADIDWIIKNYGFTLSDHLGMLHRYRDMAQAMEEHR